MYGKHTTLHCAAFQLTYLIITHFRATLISRYRNGNISRDLNFAILTNHCFSR